MDKPVIGVCTAHKGGTIPWFFFRLNIFLAGGTPLRITPEKPSSIEAVDGLIVSGGADISAELYAENAATEIIKKSKENSPDKNLFEIIFNSVLGITAYLLRSIFGLKQAPYEAAQRDKLESLLLREAIEHDIPVLGICRGMQMLNVIKGGTLYQEVADVYEDVHHPYTVLPHKRILVKEGSKLQEILKATNVQVNALHHQAVNILGEDLSISATDENDMVEAIEAETGFILGVQWHPEFLISSKQQRNLFKSLVTASKKSIGSH
jgi:putative glutamine amidotransferase